MSELKQLSDAVEKVNTNLKELREAGEKNSDHMVKFGEWQNDAKTKLEKMEADIAAALKSIVDVKRKAIAGANGGHEMSEQELEAKAAFFTDMRRGQNLQHDAAHQKALSTLVAADGGLWVPKDTSGRIVQKIIDNSPMRQYADVVTISTNAISGPIDNQEAEAGWTSETSPRTETNTPQVGQWEIPAHEMWAQPKATQTVLDDAAYDVEAWLTRKIGQRFARLENAAFITGNGTGKPKGILAQDFVTTADSTRAWGKVQYMKTGVNGAFAAAPNSGDILIELMAALRPTYWGGAIFAMNRYTLAKVMQLKNSQGEYLWLPDFSKGAQGLLLGQAVDAGFDHMPSVDSNGYGIAFGNFREAYQIVDRQGIRILRDPYTSKPFVKLYATRRVGGDVVNYEAYKVLKFAA